MSDLPPIRPRQSVGFGPGGPVIMDPTFARWLEELARGVNALNNGTAVSVSTPLPVASYAPTSEPPVAFATYPAAATSEIPAASYGHEHTTLSIPEADYT